MQKFASRFLQDLPVASPFLFLYPAFGSDRLQAMREFVKGPSKGRLVFDQPENLHIRLANGVIEALDSLPSRLRLRPQRRQALSMTLERLRHIPALLFQSLHFPSP